MRVGVLAAAVAIGLVALSAASAAGSASKPTLTIGGPELCVVSIDPTYGGLNYDNAFGLAYESLIPMKGDAGVNGPFTSGLATSWKVSQGNKRIRLTLGHDARYSDGTPVTAQSVKTYLEFAFKHSGASHDFLGPVRSVQAIG